MNLILPCSHSRPFHLRQCRDSQTIPPGRANVLEQCALQKNGQDGARYPAVFEPSMGQRRQAGFRTLLVPVSDTLKDGTPMASYTAHARGDTEGYLQMEAFFPWLRTVECTNSTMALTFFNDDDFARAQEVWDWVNGADNHSFVMVVGPQDCGWNQYPHAFSRPHA